MPCNSASVCSDAGNVVMRDAWCLACDPWTPERLPRSLFDAASVSNQYVMKKYGVKRMLSRKSSQIGRMRLSQKGCAQDLDASQIRVKLWNARCDSGFKSYQPFSRMLSLDTRGEIICNAGCIPRFRILGLGSGLGPAMLCRKYSVRHWNQDELQRPPPSAILEYPIPLPGAYVAASNASQFLTCCK